MVAETTTAPPAEDVAASEPVPKVATDPSIVTEPAAAAAAAEQEKTESRDVVDTPKSGEVTPSSARNEFIFSPQVTKAKSSESKEPAVAEETPAEEAPAEVVEGKEEEAVVAVDDEPAAEPKEETPPAEEKVEEKATPAPVVEPAPAEEEPNLIMSFLERATALCGAAQAAEIVKEDLAASEIASVSKTKSSESVKPMAKSESMTPMAKAKAALSCVPQDINEDASVALSTTEKPVEKDDLSMVLTEKEEAEEEAEEETEAAPAEEDKPVDEEEPKEEEPKEEEPKEEAEEPAAEEPAPVVDEAAPQKKKASMKKKMSQKFKGVKKVISFRTSKAKVVQSSE